MWRSCLYFFSQLFEIFFVSLSLEMKKNIGKVGLFWEDFFNAVNLSFHVKQLFLNGFLFGCQILYIFINLCDFNVESFLYCGKYFFLNGFTEIFNFIVHTLYLFGFYGDLAIYLLLYFIELTVNLNFDCFYLLMNLSKLLVEFLDCFS